LELAEAARNLFKHLGVGDKTAEALKLAVVQEALETKLLGEEPCSSRLEERKGGLKRWRNTLLTVAGK
jgi:hypothetical protein